MRLSPAPLTCPLGYVGIIFNTATNVDYPNFLFMVWAKHIHWASGNEPTWYQRSGRFIFVAPVGERRINRNTMHDKRWNKMLIAFARYIVASKPPRATSKSIAIAAAAVRRTLGQWLRQISV